MNKLIIILFLLISNSFSQVIPTELINKVDITNIPQYIPSINTNQSNILFNQYAYKQDKDLGVISYLKINSFYEGNYQIKMNDVLFPKDAYLAFYDKKQGTIYGPYTSSNESLILGLPGKKGNFLKKVVKSEFSKIIFISKNRDA